MHTINTLDVSCWQEAHGKHCICDVSGWACFYTEVIDMRKSLLGFLVLALCFVFSSAPAHAQTTVNFYIISPNTVTFTSGAGDTGTATVSITAGNGSATWGTSTGNYTFSGSATLTETAPGSNTYLATGSPLTLTLSSTSGPAGTLSGTVDLVSFTQTATSGSFNNTLIANVTVTSATGSLGSSSGNLILSLNLGSSTEIDSLGGTSTISNGAGTLYLTPEPTSMLLFGSGLLALGGALRKRLQVS
jgi:hypothetical protein